MDTENAVLDTLGLGDQELDRSASISGKPIDHPRVGIVIVCFPGMTLCGCILPMRVGESFGVLVVRIARVGVLKRRLSERKQQARCDAEMEYATHQNPNCTFELFRQRPYRFASRGLGSADMHESGICYIATAFNESGAGRIGSDLPVRALSIPQQG